MEPNSSLTDSIPFTASPAVLSDVTLKEVVAVLHESLKDPNGIATVMKFVVDEGQDVGVLPVAE